MCQNPQEGNFYWATFIKTGRRTIVHLMKNGLGHLRVFMVTRYSGSFGVEEFTDWSKPIVERRKRA